MKCIAVYDENLCHPVRGDGFKAAEEIYGDGNNLFEDGCKENS